MDYHEFLDQWAEHHIYSQIPKGDDVWENDVFEGVYRQWAGKWKQELRKLTQEAIESEAGKAMAASIQLDVFGMKADDQRAIRPVDSPAATVIQFVPLRENESADLVIESMRMCAFHTAYKLYQWRVHEELSGLLVLCEDIPEYERTEYGEIFSVMVSVITNALVVLRCDIQAKPNLGRMPAIARLHNQLNGYCERIWTIIGDAADGGYGSDDEEGEERN